MFCKTVLIVLFASSALSRNVPSFRDLDEEDHILYRAAYESPAYETYTQSYDTPTPYGHTDYHVEPLNKLDLLKDGMWAIKTKLKEMKAFNKALAANLLATKLKVKDLLAHHMHSLNKHQHVPIYYQPPTQPSYHQYEQPHHTVPLPSYTEHASQYNEHAPQYNEHAPQYNEHASQYNEHAPQYNEHAPQYNEHAPQYNEHAPQYNEHAPQYNEHASQYNEHASQYTAPVPQYTAPGQYAEAAPQYVELAPQLSAQHYGAPQYPHDPYYGH